MHTLSVGAPGFCWTAPGELEHLHYGAGCEGLHDGTERHDPLAAGGPWLAAVPLDPTHELIAKDGTRVALGTAAVGFVQNAKELVRLGVPRLPDDDVPVCVTLVAATEDDIHLRVFRGTDGVMVWEGTPTK